MYNTNHKKRKYNKNYNSNNNYNKQTQIPQPQIEQPIFNDALDILNPNFNPTQKVQGLLSLPLNPILHPIRTVKGVFETYSKVATIPLAVYSGNLDHIRGIVQGTDNFSGKDVINQLAGVDEKDIDPMTGKPKGKLHGILPSMAGFGLDILADPFVGIGKLPEEIASAGNHLITQAAAPGFPQAVNKLGGFAWLQRFGGTGSGTKNDVLVKSVKALHESDFEKVINIKQQSSAEFEARKMLLQLKMDKDVSTKNPFMQPLVEGEGFTKIANDIQEALPANYHGSEWQAILEEQSKAQVEHVSAKTKLNDVETILKPAKLEELEKSKKQIPQPGEIQTKASLSEIKAQKEFAIHALGSEEAAKLRYPDLFAAEEAATKAELTKGSIDPGFIVSRLVSQFSNNHDIDVTALYRTIKDDISKESGEVIVKHGKINFESNSPVGEKHYKFEDYVSVTDKKGRTRWAPRSQWKQNYFTETSSPRVERDILIQRVLTGEVPTTPAVEIKSYEHDLSKDGVYNKALVDNVNKVVDSLVENHLSPSDTGVIKYIKETLINDLKAKVVMNDTTGEYLRVDKIKHMTLRDFEDTAVKSLPKEQANKIINLTNDIRYNFGEALADYLDNGGDYGREVASNILFDSNDQIELFPFLQLLEYNEYESFPKFTPSSEKITDTELLNELIEFKNTFKEKTTTDTKITISPSVRDILNGYVKTTKFKNPTILAHEDPFFKPKEKGWLTPTLKNGEFGYIANTSWWHPQGLQNSFKNKVIFNNESVDEIVGILSEETGIADGHTFGKLLQDSYPSIYELCTEFLMEAVGESKTTRSKFDSLIREVGQIRMNNTVRAEEQVESIADKEDDIADAQELAIGVASIWNGPLNTFEDKLLSSIAYDRSHDGSITSMFHQIDSISANYAGQNMPVGFTDMFNATYIKEGDFVKIATPKEKYDWKKSPLVDFKTKKPIEAKYIPEIEEELLARSGRYIDPKPTKREVTKGDWANLKSLSKVLNDIEYLKTNKVKIPSDILEWYNENFSKFHTLTGKNISAKGFTADNLDELVETFKEEKVTFPVKFNGATPTKFETRTKNPSKTKMAVIESLVKQQKGEALLPKKVKTTGHTVHELHRLKVLANISDEQEKLLERLRNPKPLKQEEILEEKELTTPIDVAEETPNITFYPSSYGMSSVKEILQRTQVQDWYTTKLSDNIASMVNTPTQEVVIRRTIESDAEAVAFNLGADSLSGFIAITEGTHKAGTKALNNLKSTYEALDKHVMHITSGNIKKAKALKYKINDSAVRHMYRNFKEVINGEDIANELIKRNFTLVAHTTTSPSAKKYLMTLADDLNSQIGADLFKFEKINKQPIVKLKLNTTKLQEEGMMEILDNWISDGINGTKGFKNYQFDINVKQKDVSKEHLGIRNAIVESMTLANKEMIDIFKFAKLNDQIKYTEKDFFPHAKRSFGLPENEGILNEDLVEKENMATANYFKRRHKLSGAFSSVANDRSIIGTPFDFNIKVRGKTENFFTTNPINAYQHMFTTAFAEHTNLRIAREIMFSDKYAIKNLVIENLPETAVADFDITVPVRDKNGGLLKIKTYAPTQSNIEKFSNNGYLTYKAVSSETRALLKYENLTANSPAYKWFIKNIISPFKSGVLKNLAFPIGNAGDMAFKTWAGKDFKRLPEYLKNVAASNRVHLSHEAAMRDYATLRSGKFGYMLHDTTGIHFLVDQLNFIEGRSKADWITKLSKEENVKWIAKLKTKVGNTEEINKLYNALAFERYASLPTSTTRQRQILLEQARVKSSRISGTPREKELEDFKKWLRSHNEHPIGRALNKITRDNALAERIDNYNETLENRMRFSQVAMDMDFSKEGIRSTLKNKDKHYAVTQMIKWNHMHFSEMPGNAIWATAIMPFFQFPVKNAVWWTRLLGTKPYLAAQVDSLRKELWSDEGSDTFWAKLGGMPIGDHTVFKGIPGMGSLATFGMAVDTPLDMMGGRLNPILRPMFSDNGKKYNSYSVADREKHDDSILAAMLHGINPLESNIQAGLNFISHPSLIGLAPSVLKENKDSPQYNNKQ